MPTSKSSNLVGWQKADDPSCFLLIASVQVIVVTPGLLLDIYQSSTMNYTDEEPDCPFYRQQMTPKE